MPTFNPSDLDNGFAQPFVFTFKVNGVATDADSPPILTDACATFGIKRRDTGQIVVAAGTAMTRTGVGTYTATFTAPDWGVPYCAAVQIIYQGVTTHCERDFNGTPAPQPSAAGMVAMIMMAMRNNPAGVVAVTIDGQIVTWSRSQALEELRFWKREAAIANGTRRRATTIRMDRF